MNICFRTSGCILAFVTLNALPCFGASYLHEVGPDARAVALGLGWNSNVEQKTAASCVVAKQHTIGGQVSSEKLGIVTDAESYSKQRNESYKAAYGGGVFDASGGYTHNTLQTFSRSDTYIAVVASVSNGPSYLVPTNLDVSRANSISLLVAPTKEGHIESIPPAEQKTALAALLTESSSSIKLQDWAQKLVDKGNFSEFYRICGDGFVSEIHDGARITARMVIHDTNTLTKTDVEMTLSGSGWGASASAKITEIESREKMKHSLDVIYDQQGGKGGTFPDPTPAGLLAALASLPTIAADNPTPIALGITPYADIEGWPSSQANNLSEKVESLSKQGLRLAGLWSEIKGVLEAPKGRNQYEISTTPEVCTLTVDKLKEMQDAVNNQLKKIDAKLGECRNHNSCELNDELKFDEMAIRNALPVTTDRYYDFMYSATNTIDGFAKALATAQSEKWVKPILDERLKMYGERYSNNAIQTIIDGTATRYSSCLHSKNFPKWPVARPAAPGLKIE